MFRVPIRYFEKAYQQLKQNFLTSQDLPILKTVSSQVLIKTPCGDEISKDGWENENGMIIRKAAPTK